MELDGRVERGVTRPFRRSRGWLSIPQRLGG